MLTGVAQGLSPPFSLVVVAGGWPSKLIAVLLMGLPLMGVYFPAKLHWYITLASRGLEEPFFQLCCCVSFLFWREIGFGCTYYYVLRVPYSCGVVLVFLVLAGNSFWCYVRT